MKKIFTLLVMLTAALGMQAQDTWTVAGQQAILGVDWAPSDATNDMTSTDDVNFTLTKTGMMVKAGNYGYKVVKNHAWDEAYPADNALLPIAEDGEYTIVFSFNVGTHDVAAEATKTGEYVGPATSDWFVAGSADLLGVEWSAGAEGNKMTTEDGKIYKLVKTGVALNVDTPYPFKFVQNGSWLGNKGEGALGDTGMGGNFELFVDAPGIYTVTFTANEETMIGTVSAVKTGDAEFGEKTWTLAGSGLELFGGEKEWDPENTANDMTKVDEGYYELVKRNVNLEAKDYQFKVCANHGWGESYGDNGENMKLTVENAGTYNVTFTFLSESKTLSVDLEIATGINTVKLSNADSAVMFNLQGQRVTTSFRGIAIKNGRKMIVK
jgi:hypothetical protein